MDERLQAIERTMDKVERSVDRIEIVTVVREPNTTVAADAYNGLRKQVIAAAGERQAHLAQLAAFDVGLRAAQSAEELASLVREWMTQASLARVDDPRTEGAFEVVGEGDAVVVVHPAYVDAQTGRVVRSGIAERTTRRVEAPAQLAAPGPRPRRAPAIDGGDQ
jgi:hypothetical protein